VLLTTVNCGKMAESIKMPFAWCSKLAVPSCTKMCSSVAGMLHCLAIASILQQNLHQQQNLVSYFTILDPHTCTNINKLEQFEHNSAHYITGNHTYLQNSVISTLQNLQWPTLKECRTKHVLLWCSTCSWNWLIINPTTDVFRQKRSGRHTAGCACDDWLQLSMHDLQR